MIVKYSKLAVSFLSNSHIVESARTLVSLLPVMGARDWGLTLSCASSVFLTRGEIGGSRS